MKELLRSLWLLVYYALPWLALALVFWTAAFVGLRMLFSGV